MGIGVAKEGMAVGKEPGSGNDAEINVNRVMTIDEVAAYLQLGRRSVYRLAQRGEIPGRKILGRWRFSVREIDAWLARNPESSTAADPTGSEPVVADDSSKMQREGSEPSASHATTDLMSRT